jgi:hypothetical protein
MCKRGERVAPGRLCGECETAHRCYGCGHIHNRTGVEPPIGDRKCARCKCLGFIANEGQAAGVLGLALPEIVRSLDLKTRQISPGVFGLGKKKP